MSHQAKWEYMNAVYARYRHATVAQKSAILDECCATTGYHRKYAIRVLNGPLSPSPTRRRVRRPTYDAAMVSILAAVWDAAGYLSVVCEAEGAAAHLVAVDPAAVSAVV